MSKQRDFSTGDVLPAGFLDALNEFLGAQSSNFSLAKLTSTSIKVTQGDGAANPASGNGQVSVAIAGAWRYITGAVSASVPGALAAGTHDIYVTTQLNNSASEDAGTFSYAFGLKLLQSGGTPSGTGSEALYRKVGTFVWTGSAISTVLPFIGSPAQGSVAIAALGALTPATDTMPYFTGTGLAGTTTLSSFARTILDDTSAAAVRATIGAAATGGGLDPALMPDGSITEPKYATDSVSARAIAPDAVGSSEIAAGAVGGSELANGTILTDHMADAQVTNVKLADSSVTSAKIVDGTIVNADLAAAAGITVPKLANVGMFLAMGGAYDQQQVTANTNHTFATLVVTPLKSGVVWVVCHQHGADVRGGVGWLRPSVVVSGGAYGGGTNVGTAAYDISGGQRIDGDIVVQFAVVAGTAYTINFIQGIANDPVTWQPYGPCFMIAALTA